MNCTFYYRGGFCLNKFFTLPNAQKLFSSCAAWLISALLLALITALFMTLAPVEEAAVGYISSALSFVSALIAGQSAARGSEKGAVLTGLITGLLIITLALTLGFITAGERLTADGVLSVVTFSLAGALCGAVITPKRKRKRTKPFARKRN